MTIRSLPFAIGLGILAGIWANGASAAAVADACRQVPPDMVRTLLFGSDGGKLDSWSEPMDAHRVTCRWVATIDKAGGSRHMSLTVQTYADDAAARAAMTRLPQGAIPTRALPSVALVAGSGDQVERPDDFVVEARHGPLVAILDASGADIAAAPWEARYWLDAAALSAVGAPIRPPPFLPGVLPAGRGDPSGAPIWVPPTHDAGTPGQILAPLLALIKVLADWRFLAMAGLFMGGIALVAIAGRSALHGVRRVGMLMGVYAIANILVGPDIADRLIHRFGTAGAATITDSYETSTQYNNHDVIGYHLLIRAGHGRVVSTSFEDDDYNVYPPHNATAYPGVDDQFTVHYLPGFPRLFVIISDDGSPWATRLRCAKLQTADQAIQRKIAFTAANNAALQQEGAASAAALRQNDCQT